MESNDPQSYESIKKRLDDIVEAVGDENIPMDDALKLYEEAVRLGLQASRIMEEGIAQNNAKAADEGEVAEGDAQSGE